MAVVGLGLAALGRPGYLNIGHAKDLGEDRSVAAPRARAHEMLDAAWEAGVRHFDAARSYGRAEEFLGEWLRSRRPGGGVVSSKWGYVYTAGWRIDADPPEVKHHDVETFRRGPDQHPVPKPGPSHSGGRRATPVRNCCGYGPRRNPAP